MNTQDEEFFDRGLLDDEIDNTPLDVVLFEDYSSREDIEAIMKLLNRQRRAKRNVLFLHREPMKLETN